MDFAVSIKDRSVEGQASWVLALDAAGERFLVVIDPGRLEWVPMADCTFVKAATPDQPRLVVVVQPNTGVLVPGILPNREMRRNGR